MAKVTSPNSPVQVSQEQRLMRQNGRSPASGRSRKTVSILVEGGFFVWPSDSPHSALYGHG